MRDLYLILFVVLVVGGGAVIGLMNVPGQWYMLLEKPFFNPPDWVFGPVWTVLYVFIAVAGWRVWVLSRLRLATQLWCSQLALNFLWPPFFFGREAPLAALLIISGLLLAVIAFIVETWDKERISALLFLPYLAWVAFATVLNVSIVWLN